MISSLIPLWSESRHCVISILSLVSCVIWPGMWSILVNVPCEFEKDMYSTVVG